MNLLELSEGCISHILSLTSPVDVIRASAVSKQFSSASESDSVWNNFLPSDCDHIISPSSTLLVQRQFPNKKDLFFYLCRPILFNNCTQSFALDKKNGKKCFMFGSRMLEIAWGDTPGYWDWKPITVPQSRFPENATLKAVKWLHIKEKIQTKILSLNTTYGVYFVYKVVLKKDDMGYEYFSGFENTPVKVSVSEVDEEGLLINNNQRVIEKTYYLTANKNKSRKPEELPAKRRDGWMEVEMGKYRVDSDDEQNKFLEMIFKETKVLEWKNGLLVHGIELRPLFYSPPTFRYRKQVKQMPLSNLLDLPEECISHILSFMSPKDVVRSSAVSKEFLSTSKLDYVWDKLLPSDCDHFISQSSTPLDDDLYQIASKKDLFFYLCRSPILFNNKNQIFALDKRSGKKCYMLGARMLGIMWGDNPDYWSWESTPNSRFPKTPTLHAISWLHIYGKIHTKFLSLNTKYGVYFVFNLKNNDDGSGFEHTPVKASVFEVDEKGLSINNDHGGVIEKEFYLITSPSRRPEEVPMKRGDGWMEIEMGTYQVGETPVVLKMVLKEINELNWKRGLLVEGIELRPLD